MFVSIDWLFRLRLVAALLPLLWTQCIAPVAAQETVRVERDTGSLTRRIVITAQNGRVAWSDVLRGISRARGFNDEALDGIWPGGTFGLRSTATVLQLAGYNLLLSPHVSFQVATPDREDPQLVITVDEVAVLASRRRWKQWLRDRLTAGSRRKRRSFGLKMPDGWPTTSDEHPVVIAIHGFNSDAKTASSLLAAARQRGFACGSFDYPNDQPIDQSARLLSRQLRRFQEQHPQRRVALVTHSMGGLVARAVLEDPSLSVDCVDRLIMVAAPNQGSLLAECNFGIDVWEHVVAKSRRAKAGRFYAAVEDGLSEAAYDLRPGSVFLRHLNARPRNPRVRYTIILGTRGPLTEEELLAMHKSMEQAGDENRWMRFFGAKALAWTADLEEVVDGKGDGVVAVKRGRLDGVDDVVLLEFNHVRVLDSAAPEGHQVQALVLERLREQRIDAP